MDPLSGFKIARICCLAFSCCRTASSSTSRALKAPRVEEVTEEVTEEELAMMNAAAHTADEDEITMLESTVVESATVSSHSDAVARQNKRVNTNEGKRIERLVEQNEQKADAIKKILAEKQAAEEQDAEMTKSS